MIGRSKPIGEASFTAKSLQSRKSHTPAAEASLYASETKYQRLVEGIGGDYVIYTHDPDGIITYVSPSVEQTLGYPAELVLGLDWRELVGEKFIGRELADRVVDEVAEGKDFYSFVVEIAHADGSTRLVEIQQRPLFDADGCYISMEGIAKDITKAKRDAEELEKLKHELEHRVAERTAELIRSNELLKESEARYRTVVDCQTDYVVRWMPGAIYTFVSESFCRLMGKPSSEIVGECFWPLIHEDDHSTFHKTIASLSRENPSGDFQHRMILSDGTVRWTHWSNQMLFDDSGQFLEYQSVGRDTTELKEAADTIREKEAHLAHVSRLATMGELVAGIAHEIHQPLHAAKTFAEVARRNLEPNGEAIPANTPGNVQTAIDCTQEISDAITRAAKIIRRLREFTHFRPVRLESLALNQVVQEASDLIAFETHKADVKLDFDFAPEIPVLHGDQIQLQQVCVNVLMNAYEAMTEISAEDRRVWISTTHDGNTAKISFRDAGCGISEDAHAKLFDAFYSTKQHGMGMGLSLCKSIAEAHGGTIWAEENKGRGMTFVIELPLPQWQLGK